MRTQAETALLTAIQGLLDATMQSWPPAERKALETALGSYLKEPTPVQRVLALLKLPPEGDEAHMGTIEERIGNLLRAEEVLKEAVMVLRAVGYPRFSSIDGARWAAEEIRALRAKVAPAPKKQTTTKAKPALRAAKRRAR